MARALFSDATAQAVKDSYESAARHHRDECRETYDRLFEYARGDMLDDTKQLLFIKFKMRQSGDLSDQIGSFVLPLFQAWIEEMQAAYSDEVTFELVDESGSVNEELTATYSDACADIGYTLSMQAVEQMLLAGRAGGIHYALDKNKGADLQLWYPQDVYPVSPVEHEGFNPARQETYFGFNLDARMHVSTGGEKEPVYTLVLPGGSVTYQGKHIGDFQKILAETPHPFTWRGEPLNMFALWSAEQPVDCLLRFFEHPLYVANRELNLMWSVLGDIFRFQAGATPIRSVVTSEGVQATVPTGVAFPQVLENGETFSFAYAPVNYEGLVRMLREVARTVGLLVGLAPGDYSPDAQSAQSGFAKLVENLPKIKRRKKMARWLMRQEALLAYPRLANLFAANGQGALAEYERHKLRVTFADQDVPLNVTEQVARDTFRLDHGLTSAAELLAQEKGITREVAEELIEENLSARGKKIEQDTGQRFGLAGLIRGKGGKPKDEEDNEEGDEEETEEDEKP